MTVDHHCKLNFEYTNMDDNTQNGQDVAAEETVVATPAEETATPAEETAAPAATEEAAA